MLATEALEVTDASQELLAEGIVAIAFGSILLLIIATSIAIVLIRKKKSKDAKGTLQLNLDALFLLLLVQFTYNSCPNNIGRHFFFFRG